MIASIVLFFVTSPERNIASELSKTNWTTYVSGLCLLALEFGYLNVYRVGWKISVASLVANIAMAIILLVIGVLLYKETITVRQLIGMAACGVGLFLITKQ